MRVGLSRTVFLIEQEPLTSMKKTKVLLREFRVPLLTKPFGAAQLLWILGNHGVITDPGRSLEVTH